MADVHMFIVFLAFLRRVMAYVKEAPELGIEAALLAFFDEDL